MVNKLYPPWNGGMERHVADLSRQLMDADSSLKVSVLVGQQGRAHPVSENDGGAAITRVRTLARVARTPITTGLTGAMMSSNADVFHFHFPYPGGEMAALRANIKTPIVVTYHHDIVRQKKLLKVYRPFLDKFLARADRIVVWSPQLAANSPFLRDHQHKITVIPGGIDTARFNRTETTTAAAAELRKSISAEGPVILFVGRLVYYKGVNYLLDAMARVDGTLVLIGDGAEMEALKEQARNLGLADRVRFFPDVDDAQLTLFYQASDLLVLPSCERTEAFGLVQLEAHASGIPTICTDLPTGVTFVNRHQETGLIVPTANAGALSEAIEKLTRDQELRFRFASAARTRAIEEFDIAVCARRIKTVYEQVCNSAGK